MEIDNIFKSFSSFLNNAMQKDENLNQGKELLNYEEIYKKTVDPHLKPLQMTSSPKLSSLIETLESNSSTNSNQKVNPIVKSSKTEDEFNKKLAEYSSTYKIFIENLMNNSKDKGSVVKYYGKTVKDKDGNYTYVNNFGFTHKYLSNSWSYNDSSCPNAEMEVVDDMILNKMTRGPNMGSGQACKIAGQNVENKETNEVAWVDIKGFKHVYPSKVWNNKKESCKSTPLKLSANAYNNIPTDTPMKENIDCMKLNADPALWSKLQNLNSELIFLSKKLVDELKQINTNDKIINNKIKQKQYELDNYIKNFENDKKKIGDIESTYEIIQGQESYTSTYSTSEHNQYLIWLLLAILILLALFRSVMGEDEQLVSGLLLIILMFVLYYIIKSYTNI
jgi:hypothetical protein